MELLHPQSGAGIDGEFLKNVLDGIGDSIKIIDTSFNIIYTNSAALGSVGMSPDIREEMKGKCHEKFHNSTEQCSFCIIDRVLENGAPAYNTFRQKSGFKELVKEISAYPLTGKDGKIEYVIEIVRDVTELKNDLVRNEDFANIISRDKVMEEVFDIIRSVAAANATVLITGETGTGKELVARAIHQNSRRKDQRLVAINCGALPDSLLESELFGHEKGAFTGADRKRIGKFELAHKGTLFLDEIGTISSAMQIKILRALQEGEITRVGGNEPIKIDVRFICATNLDLAKAVKDGEFRDDLFYRINVIPIDLPPLRVREEDILLIAQHYLEIFSSELGKNMTGFSDEAILQMKSYGWPGNIRELKNLLERAVIMSKRNIIDRLDIPSDDGGETSAVESVYGATLKDVVEAAERDYLIRLLKQSNGNINDTATKAGVNTRTVHRKLKEFDIDKDTYK